MNSWLRLLYVWSVVLLQPLLRYISDWVHHFVDRSPSSPAIKIITGAVRLIPFMDKHISDKHWDSEIECKPFKTPNDVLEHMKTCEYRVSSSHCRPHSANGTVLHRWRCLSNLGIRVHLCVQEHTRASEAHSHYDESCPVSAGLAQRSLQCQFSCAYADTLCRDEERWRQNCHRRHAADH